MVAQKKEPKEPKEPKMTRKCAYSRAYVQMLSHQVHVLGRQNDESSRAIARLAGREAAQEFEKNFQEPKEPRTSMADDSISDEQPGEPMADFAIAEDAYGGQYLEEELSHANSYVEPGEPLCSSDAESSHGDDMFIDLN